MSFGFNINMYYLHGDSCLKECKLYLHLLICKIKSEKKKKKGKCMSQMKFSIVNKFFRWKLKISMALFSVLHLLISAPDALGN